MPLIPWQNELQLAKEDLENQQSVQIHEHVPSTPCLCLGASTFGGLHVFWEQKQHRINQRYTFSSFALTKDDLRLYGSRKSIKPVQSKLQLITIERKMKIENYSLENTTVITGSGKNHQWKLKLVKVWWETKFFYSLKVYLYNTY